MITTVRDIQEKTTEKENLYQNENADFLDFRIISGDFFEISDESIIKYKNVVELYSAQMLGQRVPALESLEYKNKETVPLLVGDIDLLKKFQGEKVAVEGGPCLFGTDEVKVTVIMADSSSYEFDYNTGKVYFKDSDKAEMDLGGFLLENGAKVSAIHFLNRKKGITPQEYAFIKYPFEVAKAFQGALVIPLPDMSYVKYLKAILENVNPLVAAKALDEFQDVVHEISDMYLALIDQMQDKYQIEEFVVVHSRNVQMLRDYYERRHPFIERNKVLRGLTSVLEKLESIKDYVSMPALPYYLWGYENIIEVDSMDETDSYRKCKKAHKGTIHLAAILYPELLSQDGVHTIFEAGLEYKEYGNYEI